MKIQINVEDNNTQISDDDTTTQIQISNKIIKIGLLIIICFLFITYFIYK